MTRTTVRTRRLMLFGCIVLLVSVGLLALYAARQSARQNLLRQARIDGLVAYQAGEYNTALQKLSYCLSSDRTDLEVLLAFAETRSKIPSPNGRHVLEALQLYNVALGMDPANRRALSEALALNELLGRRVEWLELAHRILELDPNDVTALRLSAVGHFQSSRLELASEFVQRLIEREPENLQWRGMQLAILRAQDAPLQELTGLCQQWIDGYSGDGRYLMMKAQLLLTAGQLAQAQQVARQAAAAGAETPDVLQPLLALLDQMNLRREADELVLLVKQRNPQEQWPHEAVVRRMWQSGRPTDALSEVNSVETNLPQLSRDLLRWKVLLLVLLEQNQSATEELAELSARADTQDDRTRDVDRAWIAAMRTRMNMQTMKWPEVLEAYKAALAMAPNEPVLHFLAGEALARVGEHELAEVSFQRAALIDPNWHAAQMSHAEALLRLQRPQAACQVLLESLRGFEGRLNPYTLLARAWLAAGEPNDVVRGLHDGASKQPIGLTEMLKRLHQAFPANRDVSELLVRSGLRFGQVDAATNVIRDALGNNETDVALLLSLARISLAERLGFEQPLIEKARTRAGLTPQVAAVLAGIYLERGDPQTGANLLMEAREAVPPPDELWSLAQRELITFLAETQDERVIEALRQLLDVDDPDGTNATFVLSQAATWDHRELAERAIASLARVAGEDSPRLAMMKAHFTLRFNASEPSQIARAQADIDRVLQIAPNSVAALRIMAKLCMTGDEPNIELATRLLQRAVAAYPDQGDLYVLLIKLLQRQANFSEADRYFDRLGELTAKQPALAREEIQLLDQQGEFGLAAQRLARLVGEESSEADRLFLFTRLHRAGRNEQAARLLEELLLSPQRSELAVRLAAEFHANNGRYDEGLSLLMHYEPTGGSVSKAINLGRYFEYNDRYTEAANAYQDALRLSPQDEQATAYLGTLRAAQGDHSAAHELAMRGLAANPSNPDLQSLAVLTSLALGQPERDRALVILSRAHDVNGALLDLIRLYGSVPAIDSKPAPTAENLDDARRLVQDHPEFMPAWSHAIDLYMRAGRHDEAVRLARQSVVRFPNLPEPVQRAAQLLVQLQRYSEALEMARIWQQRSLHRPLPAAVLIASIQLALNRPAEAFSELEPLTPRIFAESAQNSMNVAIWLQAAMKAGRIDQSIQMVRPLFNASGEWQLAWLQIAGTLDSTLSSRALQAVIVDLDGEPVWLLALASAWSQYAHRFDDAQAYELAEAYATTAGSRSQSLAVASVMIRAQNADWRMDEGRAVELLRTALSMDPDNPTILNNLADLLVRSEQKCEEAVGLISRAASLDPSSLAILDTYAHVLLCLNDPVEAEKLAQRTLAHQPDSPDFLVTLGLALATQKRWDEAEQALTRLEQSVAGKLDSPSRVLRARIDRLRGLLTQHVRQGEKNHQRLSARHDWLRQGPRTVSSTVSTRQRMADRCNGQGGISDMAITI